ncbi:MAG: Trp family transcriptional regulator [Candidatus Roizmanbacteria bacterium]|nr:Trp family transcriptional regulator [Candidatus Roizmanbacteria bacterium]
MTQISKYPLRKDVDDQISELFIDTISRITNKKLMADFLSDFLTPTEKIMFIKRLAIYYMLAKGYDYKTIMYILKVSSASVATCNKTYKYLGRGSKEVIDTIIFDEKIGQAINGVISGIVKEFSTAGKGSGVWKEIYKEVDNRNQKEI